MVRTRASFSCSTPVTHKGCPAQLEDILCAEGLWEEWGSGCQACSSPLRKVLAQGTHSAWNEGHRAGHHPLSRCQTGRRIDTPRPWPVLSQNGGWGPEGRGDSLFPPVMKSHSPQRFSTLPQSKVREGMTARVPWRTQKKASKL